MNILWQIYSTVAVLLHIWNTRLVFKQTLTVSEKWETRSHKGWQDIIHDQHNTALDKDLPHLPF